MQLPVRSTMGVADFSLFPFVFGVGTGCTTCLKDLVVKPGVGAACKSLHAREFGSVGRT